MGLNAKPAAKKAGRPTAGESASVTVRVRRDHLDKLRDLGASLGLNSSAMIKLAIGEFIERRTKG